jgi:hypothetical protein
MGDFIVLGHIGVLQHSRTLTDPDIWLVLWNQQNHRRTPTIVASGLLPYVHPGYRFVDRTLVSLTSSNQIKIKISVDTTTANAVLLETLVNDEQLQKSFAIMRTFKSRVFKGSSWQVFTSRFKDRDVTVLLPAFVGLQFYWCRTSQLSQLFLTRGIKDYRSLSNCREDGAGFADDGAYEIELKPPYDSNDLPVISRMSCDPETLKAATQICASFDAQPIPRPLPTPKFFWPFQGITDLCVYATKGWSDLYGEVVLIDRILSCTGSFPFSSVRPLHGFYDSEGTDPASVAVGSRPYQGSARVQIDDGLRTNRRKRRRRVELPVTSFLEFHKEEPRKIHLEGVR